MSIEDTLKRIEELREKWLKLHDEATAIASGGTLSEFQTASRRANKAATEFDMENRDAFPTLAAALREREAENDRLKGIVEKLERGPEVYIESSTHKAISVFVGPYVIGVATNRIDGPHLTWRRQHVFHAAAEAAAAEKQQQVDQPNVMPSVNGKPFRCDCGCNVFTLTESVQTTGQRFYRCNSCRTRYAGVAAAAERKEA